MLFIIVAAHDGDTCTAWPAHTHTSHATWAATDCYDAATPPVSSASTSGGRGGCSATTASTTSDATLTTYTASYAR